MSNSVTRRLQHTRLLCPSLSPRVCSNSCPLSWWYYLTISSSAAPFFFCLQSVPVSGSFPVSGFSINGGQSPGASASTSVLPVNIQDLFPLWLAGLIFLRELLNFFTLLKPPYIFKYFPDHWINQYISVSMCFIG